MDAVDAKSETFAGDSTPAETATDDALPIGDAVATGDALSGDAEPEDGVAPDAAETDVIAEETGEDAAAEVADVPIDPCAIVVCDDFKQCTKDTCKDGACVYLPAAGTCSDGNICTDGDSCDAGNCIPGKKGKDCDDGNPCTTDTCHKFSGCDSVNSAASCDDGIPCTVNDFCSGGQCGGLNKSCDDGNSCTADSCDITSGKCINTPINGGSCDDNNSCTSGDLCAAGVCAGDNVTCSSGSVCAPVSGCVCDVGYAGVSPNCKAGLSALSLSTGILTPEFAANTLEYFVAVDFITPTIAVSATPTANETMTLNGIALPAGVTSSAINLSLGVTDLNIVVGGSVTYVIHVARASQQAYVKSSQPMKAEKFGSSVAISGSTMVIGSPSEVACPSGATETGCYVGGAYVWVESGGKWSVQAHLQADVPKAGDQFGASVAIDGDTIVVGAPGGASGGKAYVFSRAGLNWGATSSFSSDLTTTSGFGGSVGISADTCVISASKGSIKTSEIFIFRLVSKKWSQEAKWEVDWMPATVAIDGNTVVTSGYPFSTVPYVNVFTRSGSTWSTATQVGPSASLGNLNPNFGFSFALGGNTLVVGAPSNYDCGPPADCVGEGTAFVFVRDGTGKWSQQAYLKASNAKKNAAFGTSVGISGDAIIVGSPFETSCSGGSGVCDNSGAAYIFTRSGITWSEFAILKAKISDAFDWFGMSVAISGPRVVIGATGEASCSSVDTDNGCAQAGAVYEFE